MKIIAFNGKIAAMKILVIFALGLVLGGCFVNERGISHKLYNDCVEYYDAAGIYHKKCDENLIDWPK